MKNYFVLTVFLVLFFSCGKKEGEQRNVLSFEMKTYRLESDGGCKDDTLTCASYTIEYPVFPGLSKGVSDSLMRLISQSVDTGNPEADTVSFVSAGKTFINTFETSKKEFPDDSMGWYYNATVEVNITSDSLISLSAKNDYFTGGAHGGHGTYFINLDPSTGKLITLNDLLKPGYEENLRKAAEDEFRKSLAMDASTPLSDEGFEFKDDRFQLNANYGFTNKGIVFVFNVYEIAPYVLGAQEVLVPYEKIRAWLR
jgi:hypothetical protein